VKGNWRVEWVASTLHTTSGHGVSSITTADAHTSGHGVSSITTADAHTSGHGVSSITTADAHTSAASSRLN
jgi:hypothetical protein